MGDVTMTGPLFDGRAIAAVTTMADAIEQSVSQMAINLVHVRLSQVLKHPTGYYESQIQTERVNNDLAVTDGGVIYGPWLEGVSSRNQSTRFRGYATFRQVSQQVDTAAGPLANTVALKYVEEMN